MKLFKELREELYFENTLKEGVYDHAIMKAIFLGGGPGSGKDHVMKKVLEGHGLTEINVDKAFEHLMNKEKLDKVMKASEEEKREILRKRSKNTTELRQNLAIHGRNGLIINGTADDPQKIAKIKKRLEDLGYETKMLMVHSSDDVSRQRNIERGQRGGRTVDETRIRKPKWDAVQAAKPHLAKLFGQDYHEYDNSDDLRTAPPEVVQAKTKEQRELFKTMREFTKSPSKSPKAHRWIAQELQKKDTEPITKNGPIKLPPHASQAAEQAKQLNLRYHGSGRYGPPGKVTHRVVNDNLIDMNDINPQVNQRPRKITEAVSITITGDTSDEVKQAINLLKTDNQQPTYNQEESTFSNDSSYKLLTLGKFLREGNKDVEFLKESVQEERTENRISSYGRTETRHNTSSKRGTEDSSGISDYRRSDTISEEENYKTNYPKGKITFQQIRDRKEEKQLQKESIDKGIEPGISMAAAGESPDRDKGEQIKKKTGKATQVAETAGGPEMATSMSNQKEEELRRKGIRFNSWRANKSIGS